MLTRASQGSGAELSCQQQRGRLENKPCEMPQVLQTKHLG